MAVRYFLFLGIDIKSPNANVYIQTDTRMGNHQINAELKYLAEFMFQNHCLRISQNPYMILGCFFPRNDLRTVTVILRKSGLFQVHMSFENCGLNLLTSNQ